MAKHPDPRRLRSALTYTVPELARACGVTEQTVRNWLKDDLEALTTQRPTLIIGDSAKEYLNARRARKKQPTAPDELYCMSCKAPRKMFEGMVALIKKSGQTPRIEGFCETCETVCSRMVRRTDIPALSKVFQINRNPSQAA